ncbi:PAS domain-containing sensor histidine kinase [Geothrix sp. 21YS21S-4]|uniref:hybrid sensor histidine kinase/response regulator n=1 Tax=Geothrix sp. 21YS21S-4 TaxID=3068889 RepID=UPI0027BAC7FF|nr:PAS domain-containing sensor histidine kinase [Geothrix sp. 21YS21S-4]
MGPHRSLPQDPNELRRSAELTLARKEEVPLANVSKSEALRLLHELQVHQIELEMQNGELKRSGEEIEALLEAYTDLYDHAPVGYLVIDRKGEIWRANLTAATLLETSRSSLVGSSFPEWMAPRNRADFFAFLDGHFAGNPPGVCELPLRPRNAMVKWIRIEASWPSQREECRLAFVDITEQHQAEVDRQRYEMEIQHAQQLDSLGRLAAGVAHDINNILGAIYAVTETLKLNVGVQGEFAGSLALIEKAAVRGKELVSGLTRFSRKDPKDPEPVDLHTLVSNQISLLERTSSHSIQFTMEACESHPFVLAQPARLSTALMNLCANSTDAMSAGGRLSLRIQRLPGSLVELSVEDTGCGMLPEVRVRAHEPFFTTKPIGLGTGQGLSMALETARAMGGEMVIESRFGQGTTVSLILPELLDPKAAVPPEKATDTPIGRSLTILFVDDDELMQSTIPPMFRVLGHKVMVAVDGLDALRYLSMEVDFDLVILDHNMPGMTGLETLAELRRLHPTKPVLLATGNLEPKIAKSLRQDPWARGIEKPFSIREITKLMRELIPEDVPGADQGQR